MAARRHVSSSNLTGTEARNTRWGGALAVGLLFLAGQHTAIGQIPGPCGAQKAGTIACLTLDTLVQAVAAVLPPSSVSPEAGSPANSGNVYLVTPLTASQPSPSPASGFVYTF